MRERGISGMGVDALADAAGMTHGSLYSQFGSKERLVEEAVAHAIIAKGREVPDGFTLGDYFSEYLSAGHRDKLGSGCPFAALSCEMPRQSAGVRERFTAGVRDMIGLLSGRIASTLKPRQREEGARDRRRSGRGTRAGPRRERSQAVGRYLARDQKPVGRLIAPRGGRLTRR
ncbi:helix-turn-helix domain-containing protein [Bradyrhizobium sp. RDM4]|uniref:TetR/AcrR family transcriptional regulator n=1 Tax=Bradyrhizobium sp. RDM4 TaxID=3378765 RepID=UPI0038FCA6A9